VRGAKNSKTHLKGTQMSSLYEALQMHRTRGETAVVEVGRMRGFSCGARSGQCEMESLYQSLESAVPTPPGKLLLFTASHRGEGTTTIVTGFASTIAATFGAAVLLVTINPDRGADYERLSAPHFSDLAMNGQGAAIERKRPGVVEVRWNLGAEKTSKSSESLAMLSDVTELRRRFDYTIFDTPPAAAFPFAVSIGRYVDGAVIVVQAERTRWPVVDNTRRAYEAAGTKVLGVVLNKRRFYIPDRIYRWL
jgi:protein-tyrosine kinase